MRRPRSAENRDVELNVVPMMNLFVALVPFLLLSAVFVHLATIDLGAGDPSSDVQYAPRADPATVVVTETEIRLGHGLLAPPDRRIDRASPGATGELEVALADFRAAGDGPEIILASAARVRYQDLVTIIDTAAAAGFTDLALAAVEENGDER